MTHRYIERVVSMTVGIVFLGFSHGVHGKVVWTPVGPADDSCVHEIPKGASLDLESGNLSVNHTVVGHQAPCTVDVGPEVLGPLNGTMQIPGGAQWYAWSDAQWPVIGGVHYPFDKFLTTWKVPTNPTPPVGDTSFEFFFHSVQNNQGLSNDGQGCGPTTALLQPVLQWGNNGAFGSEQWMIASWVVWSCNSTCTMCNSAYSTPEPVTQHDHLEGYVWEIQSGGGFDGWQVELDDNTSLAYTYEQFTLPSSWPKFGSIQGAVIEAYNVDSNCDDLSPDNKVVLAEQGVWAGYPSWNSFDRVDALGANLLSWQGYLLSSPSPNCNWNTISSSTQTTLQWVNR